LLFLLKIVETVVVYIFTKYINNKQNYTTHLYICIYKIEREKSNRTKK